MKTKIQLTFLSLNILFCFNGSLITSGSSSITSDSSVQTKNHQRYLPEAQLMQAKEIRKSYKQSMKKLSFSLELKDTRKAERQVAKSDREGITFVSMAQAVSTDKA
jgi:hypothetical protein